MKRRPFQDLLRIVYHLVMVVFCLLLATPGFVMNGPIAVVLNYLAEKERVKVSRGEKGGKQMLRHLQGRK